MKANWKLIAVVAGASLLVIILFFRSCDIEDRYSRLQGEYNALKLDYEESAKVYEAERADLTNHIGDLTKEIGELKKNAGKPTQAEKEKDKTIAGLMADIEKWKKLGDCPKALEAAEGTIKQWSEKFTLAEERYTVNFNNLDKTWDMKYQAQAKISLSYKAESDDKSRVIDAGDKVIAALKWDLRKARLFGTLKSGLVLGLAGYVVYNIVKGK